MFFQNSRFIYKILDKIKKSVKENKMPTVYLPYINIALNAFALLVAFIILASCTKEFSRKKSRTNNFFFLLCAVIVALIAEIVAWITEGHVYLTYITIISNTITSCALRIAIIFFMGYLKENLYESSKAVDFIMKIFWVLCGLSIAFSIGNAFFGYAFAVNEHGHWERTDNLTMGIIYLLFPVLSFLTIVLIMACAKRSSKINLFAFFIYTIFPVAGIIIDHIIHGLSLTYVGLTVSMLVIYTSIYTKKQQLIESQRNALMLSQINPHFIYNTLSTIAAMCDVSPNQAKHLTIDFSKYLRQNLSSISSEELIPFDKELEHVECYLKIEKARFRERLNVVYSIQCRDFNIPPLTVQPIVENAVKHGITKRAEGGMVKVSTYDTDKHYVVEIKDDGVGFNTDEAEMHVGLENVRSRIMMLCKGDVSVKSTVGVGTRITIEIPKKGNRR